MGLDAFVYCDCFERDALRCSAPAGSRPIIAENGNVICGSGDEEAWAAFDLWKNGKACLHSQMILAHRALGSAEQVQQLRTELGKEPRRFPLLLGKVLYDSTHTCDWIPTTLFPALSDEVGALSSLTSGQGSSGAISDALHLFQIQMAELIIAARSVNKPICF